MTTTLLVCGVIVVTLIVVVLTYGVWKGIFTMALFGGAATAIIPNAPSLQSSPMVTGGTVSACNKGFLINQGRTPMCWVASGLTAVAVPPLVDVLTKSTRTLHLKSGQTQFTESSLGEWLTQLLDGWSNDGLVRVKERLTCHALLVRHFPMDVLKIYIQLARALWPNDKDMPSEGSVLLASIVLFSRMIDMVIVIPGIEPAELEYDDYEERRSVSLVHAPPERVESMTVIVTMSLFYAPRDKVELREMSLLHRANLDEGGKREFDSRLESRMSLHDSSATPMSYIFQLSHMSPETRGVTHQMTAVACPPDPSARDTRLDSSSLLDTLQVLDSYDGAYSSLRTYLERRGRKELRNKVHERWAIEKIDAISMMLPTTKRRRVV
jgi:hypothetical protein